MSTPRFENHLLAALPAETIDALRPHLRHVSLAVNAVLYGPGTRITTLYFPETAVASVLTLLGRDAATRDGAPDDPSGDDRAGGVAIEIGTVGREGVVGLDVFLSGDGAGAVVAGGEPAVDGWNAPPRDAPGVRAVAQLSGTAWCIAADAFTALAAPAGALHTLMLRYTQAYLGQVAQTAACNAAHRVEARCARWLLATHDRTRTDWLPLTRGFLSAMLGVRETGAVAALAGLEARRVIAARPDGVLITDRRGLERVTCACYVAVRAEHARLLGTPSGSGEQAVA